MTKAGQTSLLQRRDGWIAIGVFAEGTSVIAALKELTSIGVSLPDLCLAGMPTSMHRLASVPDGQHPDSLRALLRSAAETRLPGCDVAILASPTCSGSANALLSAAMAGDKLRGHIGDGCIVLGVSTSRTEAAEVGRILLRYSSHHVHMLQGPLAPSE